MKITLQLTEKAFLNPKFFIKRILVDNGGINNTIFNYEDLSDDNKTIIDVLSVTLSCDLFSVDTVTGNIFYKVDGVSSKILAADMDSCLSAQVDNLIAAVIILID